MPAWTTPEKVDAALGEGTGALADPYLVDCVDAANAWCYRKRLEAGYIDDPDPDATAPSADVALAATLYAVGNWRERASVDGFQGYPESTVWSPTGGSMGKIKALLGVPRAMVDRGTSDLDALELARRRRRHLWRVQ